VDPLAKVFNFTNNFQYLVVIYWCVCVRFVLRERFHYTLNFHSEAAPGGFEAIFNPKSIFKYLARTKFITPATLGLSYHMQNIKLLTTFSQHLPFHIVLSGVDQPVLYVIGDI